MGYNNNLSTCPSGLRSKFQALVASSLVGSNPAVDIFSLCERGTRGASVGVPVRRARRARVPSRCHVYKEGELEELFDHIESWVRVTRAYFDCGNWCVEAERIA